MGDFLKNAGIVGKKSGIGEHRSKENSMENFSVTPVKAKKIVARVWRRPTDATIGILKLTGKTDLLNFLCASGLGSRRSEGHGLVNVIW